MKAIVYFKDGNRSLVNVNSAYSRGGVIYYNLTLNATSTLDFTPGVTKTFTDSEINTLTYVMS